MALDDQGVVFSKADARRIRQAVRFFESYREPVERRRKRSVAMPMAGGTHDDPLVLYNTVEGSETAQIDTWDRTSQGDNDGVIIRIQTRTVYNDAGDEKLYAFHRDLTFDSKGILVSISAETRSQVDVPEAC